MKKVEYRFDAWDYVFFGIMLGVSALTGVFIAWRNRKKRHQPNRLKEYLTGNRNLKTFPVAMSLIASYISGVTMVGTPAEIYNFGTQYWLIIFAMTLSGVCVAAVYLPVFTTLQVCSSYEYLELRFGKVLRSIASLFFLLDEIMFLPTVIYVPSLAFNQVSGVNLHIIGAIVCVICVFYTYLGGLKAVVYTDTWQTIVMFIAIVVVVIVGVIDIGGFREIFDRVYAGHRMDTINFNPSMYERYSIFSVLIGGFTYWTAFNSINQTMVQRYLSLPSEKQAKFSVSIFTLGVVLFISLCCFSGVLLFAMYHKCDPLSSKRIAASDQLLPLFVMEVAGYLKGLPGLFIAGVFGAALSSLSVVLNSTAIVLLEDFFRGMCHLNLTERRATIISKVIITSLGAVAVALVFVIERIGSGVFEIATTFSAINTGTMFGVFSLGMLVPWANNKGAISGAIAGFLLSGVAAYGKQIAVAQKLVVAHQLPVSVEQCEEIYGLKNVTVPEVIYPDESDVFPLFRISFLWVTPIGLITTMLVGIIVSFITGKNDPRYLDPELISPVAKWMLPKESENYTGTAILKVKNQRLLGSSIQVLLTPGPVNLNDMGNQEPSTVR